MSQSIPVHELSDGKYVYQDQRGTYSHQHPTEPGWCESHTTVEEAVECFKKQQQAVKAKQQG